MPSNQQRREAAKRKLARQLVRREEVRKRRRRTTLIGGTLAVLLVAGGVVWLITGNRGSNTNTDTASAADSSADATTSSGPATPCTYTVEGTAAKEVKPPSNTSPAREGTVAVTMDLNGETVDIELDRSKAPCSVNSFLSLASQGFYNDTTCHRLTASEQLNVLQCGDPTGQGNGGPGYGYTPTTDQSIAYPVGTLAMANTGTSEGSQFFIVYGTTTIDPSYSVIGKVSEAGMKVVDAITSQGVKDDRQDGPPNGEAKIGSITVPQDAVSVTTQWPTSSAADTAVPTEPLPTDSVPAETVDSGTGEPPTTSTESAAEPSATTSSAASSAASTTTADSSAAETTGSQTSG